MLEVQAQLTDVRGQIEALTAQLKDVGDRAAYATLAVQFGTPVVAVEVGDRRTGTRRPWSTRRRRRWSTRAPGLAAAGIWFAIVWLPILLVLAVLAVAGAWILRRSGLSGVGSRRPRAHRLAPPPPPDPISA